MSVGQWLHERVNRAWYRSSAGWLRLMTPLALLFGFVVWLKKKRQQRVRAEVLAVPVVVVGNLSVGGTGKTPLVVHLVEQLTRRGIRVGVISRGYGGKSNHYPLTVGPDTPAGLVGDEPRMLWEKTGCPVVVAPRRLDAAHALLRQQQVDVLLCDDGLQHGALPRDYEICVVDGVRGLGNGHLLPVGPLREPPSRLQSVDYLVRNGGDWQAPVTAAPLVCMTLVAGDLIGLGDRQGERLSLDSLKGQRLHAYAGIGNPGRFFELLRQYGAEVIEHPFVDHHQYQSQDFSLIEKGQWIVMTEKDAVKCAHLGLDNAWALPVVAELSADITQDICRKLGLFVKPSTIPSQTELSE